MEESDNELVPTGPTDAGMLPIWFQRIHNEIEEARAALYAQKGILFLKVHRFTQEEILSFPAFKAMRSLCAQIDVSFSKWRIEGTVSDETLKYYHESRLEIEKQMGILRAEIQQRNPTMLESIGEFFSKAVRYILDKLPMIPYMILQRIGLAPATPSRLSRFDSDLDEF
jgi:hypothetical protein